MKNIFQKLTLSLKKKIPINAVPTAPTPANTAYEMLIGIFLLAIIRNHMLKKREMPNAIYHNVAAFPDVSFAFTRHEVNPTSKSPAKMRIIQ